jgi:hypothetical protein
MREDLLFPYSAAATLLHSWVPLQENECRYTFDKIAWFENHQRNGTQKEKAIEKGREKKITSLEACRDPASWKASSSSLEQASNTPL